MIYSVEWAQKRKEELAAEYEVPSTSIVWMGADDFIIVKNGREIRLQRGFDRDGFMEHLEQSFNGFDNCWLRGIVNNVIDYAAKHEHVSKDQFAQFVSDMLPEISFGEVAAFCENGILTERGKDEKAAFLLHQV